MVQAPQGDWVMIRRDPYHDGRYPYGGSLGGLEIISVQGKVVTPELMASVEVLPVRAADVALGSWDGEAVRLRVGDREVRLTGEDFEVLIGYGINAKLDHQRHLREFPHKYMREQNG